MRDLFRPSPLGRRVKKFRQMRGWSQDFLAEEAQLKYGYISLLECGRIQDITLNKAVRLAKALRIPLSMLAGEREG